MTIECPRIRSLARAFAASILVAVLCSSLLAQSGEGAVRGIVYDAEYDVPLEGVRVSVVETGRSVSTALDGTFLIEGLPAGSFTLSLAKGGYERTVLRDVVVLPGRVSDVDRVVLDLEVVELDPLVVMGSDLLGDNEMVLIDIRAESVNLQDSISTELIGKAGASDVAAALKLVVGVSARDGKYATVRGLSDRYTGTTLNGIRVPSADPRRKAVQVDLFPTGTIESLTVTKTFTPDLQGDFTGGGVDIRTKSVPDEPLLKLDISTEYNEYASRDDRFLTYQGGGVDGLGRSGSERELPIDLSRPIPPISQPQLFPTEPQIAQAQQLDVLTRAFSPVIGTSVDEPGLNRGFKLTAGRGFDVGGSGRFGLVGAVSYSHKYDFFENGENNSGIVTSRGDPPNIDRPRTDSRGTDELLVGALASVVYQPTPNHEIAIKTIFNRGAEDSARFQVQNPEQDTVEQNQTLRYVERTVRSEQLHGRHDLVALPMLGRPGTPLSIDWAIADNFTRQEEPDVRFFRNSFNRSTLTSRIPSNSTPSQNTRRIFRDIQERNEQGFVNVRVPFTQWTRTEGQFKIGLFRDLTDRTFTQDSFTYQFVNQYGNQFLNSIVARNAGYSSFTATSDAELWTDVFLDDERLGLSDTACEGFQNPFSFPCASANQLLWVLTPVGDDVDYTGEQTVDAWYAMVELPLSAHWTLIGGVRHEQTEISIMPVNPIFGVVEVIEVQESGARAVIEIPDVDAAAQITSDDRLPSLGVTWEITPEMKLRAAWSRTLARPTFRELAPVATEEFIFGDEFLGNPELVLSEIENYDLRWEWFRRPGEVLAVSVFYKELTNPIELISFGASNRTFVQPVNFERGELRGAELEARSALGFIGDRWRDVTIGFNVAMLDTEAEVPLTEQIALESTGLDSPTRRLQGQPEYLLNLNIGWDDVERGTSISAFYNLTGETLETGAAAGVEDGIASVYEDVNDNLDVTIKHSFPRLAGQLGRKISLTLRGKNLLGSERRELYRTPLGDEATKSLRPEARRVSLSASLSW